MRKILLLLACIMMATTSLFAAKETRSIVVNAETMGIDKTLTYSTQQLGTITKDGITVNLFSGWYSTSDPQYFNFCKNAMASNSTQAGYVAVTGNTNNYDIIGIDVNVNALAPNLYRGYNINKCVETKPSYDSTSSKNHFDIDEWEFLASCTPTVVKKYSHDFSANPQKYIIFYASGTSYCRGVDEITIYYEAETDDNPDKEKPNFKFTDDTKTVTTGETNLDLGLITNVPIEEVVWSVTPDNGGIRINSDGTFNAIKAGIYTITANFAGNSTYNPATATTTVVVKEDLESSKEKLEFRFDIEELRVALNNGTGSGNLYDCGLIAKKYFVKDSKIPTNGVIWTIEPVGNSPQDGIAITTYQYLQRYKDGEYILIASWPGTEEYEAVEARLRVISGEGAPAGTADPTFAFAKSKYEMKVGEKLSILPETNLPANCWWDYSVTPATGLTVDDDGNVTATAAGTYTLTASFAGNINYNPATATTTVEVTDNASGGGDEPGETTNDYYYFTQSSVSFPVGSGSKSMFDYLYRASGTSGAATWSFEPVGASPADGIKISYGYLTPSKDGEYIVTAHYPGNATFAAVDTSIRVIVGAGAPAGPAVAPEFGFEAPQYNMTVGDTMSIAVKSNLPADAEITYTVSPATGLNVAANGDATAVKAGTYSVKADFAGNDSFTAASAVTSVVVANQAGVKVDPVFDFTKEEIDIANTAKQVNLRDYMEISSDISAGLISYSWRAYGDSPENGIKSVTGGYLIPNEGVVGTYIITATFAGNDTYNYKMIQITVNLMDEVKEPVYGTARPSTTSPANGATLPSTANLENIVLTYPSAVGDIDVIDRNEGVTITLTKDGQVVEKVPTSDRDRVYLSRNNYSELNVKISPLFAPGHYTLTVPANILKFAPGDSGAVAVGISSAVSDDDLTDEELFKKYHNAEYKLEFDVVFSPSYTITPAPGAVKQSELKHIEIVYASGVTVGPNNPPYAPGLYYRNDAAGFDESNNPIDPITNFGKYTVKYEGNKVILDFDASTNLEPSPENSTVKYYYISVPNNCWIANYNGTEYPFVGQKIEKYSVIDETIGEVKGSPWLSINENSDATFADLRTIKLYYPESYSFNEWKTTNPMGKKIGNTAIATLRKVADATSTYGTDVATYMLSAVDEANRTLTLTLLDKANVESETGMHCISLATNTLIGADKKGNGFMYFKGINITNTIERQDVNFSYTGELELMANAPYVPDDPELPNDDRTPSSWITFSHHEDFGNGFHLSIANATMHLDHISEFGGIYEAPKVKMVASGTNGKTKIGFVTHSAGHYNLKFSMPNSLFFNECTAEFKVKVLPSPYQLGLTIAGSEIYEDDVDYFVAEFDGEDLGYDRESATNAQFAFTNFSGYAKENIAKVWYKVTEPGAKKAPRKVAATSTEGYMLEGEQPLNLHEIAVKGKGLSFIIEQNGVLSKPMDLNLMVYSGIPTSVAEITDINTEVRYYDLQGHEVKNPANGLYIRISNGKAEKVMLK